MKVRIISQTALEGRVYPRNTFEGLIDVAAECYTDGPKVSIICDELSLTVNGCGNKIAGVIWSAVLGRRMCCVVTLVCELDWNHPLTEAEGGVYAKLATVLGIVSTLRGGGVRGGRVHRHGSCL